MKKIIKMIVTLVLCLPLVGCAEIDESQLKDGTPLVIILGKHANAKMFTKLPDKLSELIDESITVEDNDGRGYTCKANIDIIINDGFPTKIPIDFELENSTNEYNTDYLESNKEEIKNEIKELILSDEIIADDEESDLLAALSEAENILNNKKANIYIYDSGLTTTGYLNMNNEENNIMTNEVDNIVKKLVDDYAIPSLKGVTVEFEGIGNVAEPQDRYKTNNKYKTQLTNLWKTIIKKAGANPKTIDFSDNSGIPMVYNEDEEGEKGYPYVSPVSIGTGESNSTFVYQASQLGFEGGSAEFRDGTALAKKNIRDLQLSSLNNYVNYEEGLIYVVGSVAKTSVNQNLKNDNIARDRAQKVMDILIELGIPASRIKVIDAGTTKFSWRNKEEFPNGKTEPNKENQQANRVVAIIPDSQECYREIEELKSAGYIN